MSDFIDVINFSGGMADIDTPTDRSKAEIVENFNITSNGKLRTREGSEALDNNISTVSGDGRIQALVNYDEDRHLVVLGSTKAYSKNNSTYTAGGAWSEIQSPNTGFSALPANGALTAGAAIHALTWKNHVLVGGMDESNGYYVSPQKLFLDETNTWKVRNASLEAPQQQFGTANYAYVIEAGINLAKELKSRFNTHVTAANTHLITGYSAPIIVTDPIDEQTLILITEELISKYNDHVQNDLIHYGTSSINNPIFSVAISGNYNLSKTSPKNAYECAVVLNQLRFAFNCHTISFMARSVSQFVMGAVVTFNVANSTLAFTGTSYLRNGDAISVVGGTLPTPLVANTTYYVTSVTQTTIKLATTFANAIAGTSITLGGAPAGTTRAYAHFQNVHNTTTTPVRETSYVYTGMFYPTENSNGYYSASSYQVITPPHIMYAFGEDIADVYSALTSHLSGSFHINSPNKGYVSNPTDFYNDLNPTEDVFAFMTVLKAHHALLIHRTEGLGVFHANGTSDPAGSALTYNQTNYPTGLVPDVWSSVTWTLINNLFVDVSDNLTGETTSHVRGTVYGGTRHSGTIPATSVTNGRAYDWTFAQISYAVVARSRRKLYTNDLFEDVSSPLYCGSFCVIKKAVVSSLVTNLIHGTAGSPDILVAGSERKIKYYFGSFWFYTTGNNAAPPPISASGARPYVLANENIEFTECYVDIYRTVDAGSVYYLDTTIKDDLFSVPLQLVALTTSDSDILTLAQELYTTGGTVPYDPLPRYSTATLVLDTAYYGNIAEVSSPKRLSITFATGTPSSTITCPFHGLKTGDKIFFSKAKFDGLELPLPSNIITGKPYYALVPAGSPNAFKVTEYPGGTELSFVMTYDATAAAYVETLEYFPRRVRQSIPGNIFSSPESFYVDLDSDVVCLSTAKENPIAICKEGVYRLEGGFSTLGIGALIPKRISDRIGGVSANCAITINGLCFFMGYEGFYMTDGYTVKPLTPHMRKMTTDAILQDKYTFNATNAAVKCAYDSKNNRILWIVGSELWVLHLSNSQDDGSFSKWLNTTSWIPTALAFFRGNVLRGESTGVVLKHSSSLTNDAQINGSTVSTTNKIAIPFKFRSLPDAFGNIGIRKWVSKLLLRLTNLGNATLGLKSANDRNTANLSSLRGVKFRQEYSGQIKEMRTFPSGIYGTRFQGLRCHEKQIQIEPELTILYKSDDYSVATVASGTVTLSLGTWPTPNGSIIGHIISFETDGYGAGYPITAVSGNTLSAAAPNMVGKKWVIRGIPKTETLELQSYSLYYEPVNPQPNPPTGQSGGNA